MPVIRNIIDNTLVGFLHLLSLLPMNVLYVISSVTSWLLFDVFRYKRMLVTHNLTRAFPDSNQQDIQTFAKNTYQHHLDIIAELIKTLRLSPEALSRKVTITNPELIETRLDNDQPVLLVTSHFGNWEWLQLACAAQFNRPPSVLYKRITHSAFDKLLIKLRTRFGSSLIATDQVVSELRKRQRTSGWIAMAADLAPRPEEKRYWAKFLGIETAFYSGLTRIMKMTHASVIYGHMQRTHRGHYQLTFELLAENDGALTEATIMQRYIESLEKDIRQTPSEWIWFYKRWKHERPQSEQVGQPQHD